MFGICLESAVSCRFYRSVLPLDPLLVKFTSNRSDTHTINLLRHILLKSVDRCLEVRGSSFTLLTASGFSRRFQSLRKAVELRESSRKACPS